jgi:hypothetical protein
MRAMNLAEVFPGEGGVGAEGGGVVRLPPDPSGRTLFRTVAYRPNRDGVQVRGGRKRQQAEVRWNNSKGRGDFSPAPWHADKHW